MSTNVEHDLLEMTRRQLVIEEERRAIKLALKEKAEDLKELRVEYRNKGLTKDEIRGVSLVVDGELEDPAKRVARTAAEEVRDRITLARLNSAKPSGAGD